MGIVRTRGRAAGALASAFLAACLAGGCAHAKAAARAAEEEAARRNLAEMEEARRLADEREAALVASLNRVDPNATVVSKVSFDERYATSYLVVTKTGTRIVVDPYKVPVGVEADLVLSTHVDMDHNDRAFYGRTAARKSLYSLESLAVKDVRATGIPASHYGDDFDPAKPTDVIYLVEADGLRLAFMGDICQTRLNEAQLAALGRVDLAFIIMEDAPDYGYETARTLAMLRQLEPRLAFPLHPTDSVVAALGAALGGVVHAPWRFAIGEAELASGPTRIVRLAPLSAN